MSLLVAEHTLLAPRVKHGRPLRFATLTPIVLKESADGFSLSLTTGEVAQCRHDLFELRNAGAFESVGEADTRHVGSRQ